MWLSLFFESLQFAIKHDLRGDSQKLGVTAYVTYTLAFVLTLYT